MKKFFNSWSPLFAAILATASATVMADSNNFLTGIAHTQLSADLTPNAAGMAAAEVGPRNYRLSGTLGYALNYCNRVKVTGEWLWQDIDYSFITGTQREWVQQPAVGVGYQLVLNNRFLDYFEFTGYYAHANSKTLQSVDFLDQASGNIYQNLRRIAGSNATGASPAAYFNLWTGAVGSLAFNWDRVSYDQSNTAKVSANGYGGTARLIQALQICSQNFKIDALASVRAPFDFYRAEFDWVNPLPTSQLLLGLFADYTKGKKSLPNTSLVGINVSYAIDTPPAKINTNPVQNPAVKPNSLLSWVSDPAVYMPQVLAMADGSTFTCTPGSQPSITGTVGDIKLSTLPLDLSKRFTGNGPLTYSLTKSAGDATIDPSTGKVTATVPSTNIVVTASGPCGPAASTNSFNIIAG